MVIRYVAYTWQGQRVEGVLPVDREEEALALLERDELIPYRLVPVRPRRSLVQLAPSLFRPQPQELIEFTRGMATLLRAGVPLREGLRIFREQSRSLGMKEILRRVIQDIEAGGRFSEACSRHPAVFSAFYVRLLRISEAAGGLSITMEGLAETLARQKALRDRVKAALAYPAVSLAVGVAAAFILVTYAMPALVGLLKEYHGQLPLSTRLLIATSDAIQVYKLYVMAAGAGIAAVVWGYTRTLHGQRVRDRLMLRIPVVGGVVLKNNLFSLTSTFSTLLEAGVPPVEALELSRESLNNVVLQERLDRVIVEVREGTHLGQAFSQHELFPPLLSQGVVTGEVGGALAPTLRALSEYYQQETTRSINAATELIQPVVMLLVAGFVGFIAVAVVSGIYSTVGQIK